MHIPCAWPALSHRSVGQCWWAEMPAAVQQCGRSRHAAHQNYSGTGPIPAVHTPTGAAQSSIKYLSATMNLQLSELCILLYMLWHFCQCKRLMGKYVYAVLVGWQSLTPGCPSVDENHSTVRQTQAAQTPERDDPQNDGSNSQPQSFSGIIPAWTPEGSDKTTRVLLRGKKKKHARIFRNFRSTWYTVSRAVRLTFRPHNCSLTDPRSDPTKNSSVDFSSADLSHSNSPYKKNVKGISMLQHP